MKKRKYIKMARTLEFKIGGKSENFISKLDFFFFC